MVSLFVLLHFHMLGVMLFFVITGSVVYSAWCNILSVSQESSLSTNHSTVKFIVSIQVASIKRTFSNAVHMFIEYKCSITVKHNT